jgi:CheY-like chemotaxis protein
MTSASNHYSTHHVSDDGTRYTPGEIVHIDHSSGRVQLVRDPEGSYEVMNCRRATEYGDDSPWPRSPYSFRLRARMRPQVRVLRALPRRGRRSLRRLRSGGCCCPGRCGAGAILDIVMPGRDGFEVCRAVRADPDVRDMPLILISGNATEAEARAAGANAFLAKPFLPSALLAIVDALAGAGRTAAAVR